MERPKVGLGVLIRRDNKVLLGKKMLTVMVHGVRLGATLREEKVLSKVVCEKLKKKWV